MAKKPTITTLQSGFNSTETLNANFEALRDSFDNTLSLDGSTPNAMEADLDLNGNNIIGAAGLLINGTDYLVDVEAAKAAALAAQAGAEASETTAGLSATAAALSAEEAEGHKNAITGLTAATGAAGSSVSYNSSTGVLTVPRGDVGATGPQGIQGIQGIAGASGTGSGDMLAANNLSDLTSISTARTNLGLGTAATTASTDYATAAQGAKADTATQPADLGTAAATDSTDYATAAQGTLADSAVQPNDSPTFGTVNATSFSGDGSALTGLPAGYTNADVDTHLNYSTAITGQVLSFSGSDYDWIDAGGAGAGGGGSDEIFWENGQNVTSNYTVTNGKNAMSAGPITIDSGVTVTVGAGETWTVV